MNQKINSDHASDFSNSEPSKGFVHLLSTPTIFAMDLIRKNLQLNDIETQWNYPDVINAENESAILFVKLEQHEQALSILTSLDLLDFTIQNGK
jgi:hypothetical protein